MYVQHKFQVELVTKQTKSSEFGSGGLVKEGHFFIDMLVSQFLFILLQITTLGALSVMNC